jgi:hypothetical protein
VADDTILQFSVSTGTTRVLVSGGCANDGVVAGGWSPDGTYLTYMREIWNPSDGQDRFEWHLVGHGADRVVATAPPWCHCGGGGDSDSLDAAFSLDGRYMSWVATAGPRSADLQVRTLDGQLVGKEATGSMDVWAGGSLYYEDQGGIEKWTDGAVTTVAAGATWIRPHASPDGTSIAYFLRGADSLGRVWLLDTATGKSRELLDEPRSEPVFLTNRYLWYRGDMPCAREQCPMGPPVTASGTTYVYDLQDGTESPSAIAAIYDVWPHGS